MAHGPIRQHLAGEVVHSLVHCNDNLALRIRSKAHRLDMWIDQGPLARPVGADAIVPVDVAAVHPVRPDNVLVQDGENRFQVTGIETIIEMFETFRRVGHRHAPSWIRWPGRRTADDYPLLSISPSGPVIPGLPPVKPISRSAAI